MIELRSEKTAEETLVQLQSHGLPPRKLKKALKSMEKHLLKADVSHIHDFHLFSVVDENGTYYDEIEFTVTSRYKRNGDTYLAGEAFCVNISKLMRESYRALRSWK